VLYRAARADPGRRFHALRDKVYREDVVWRAWYAVRRSNGAPGIDKTTLADVEEDGVTRLLGELASELQAGTWRPLPARKVLIPKPGSSERRPLAIAAVRDRIVQAAMKIVLEPVFEADFLPCSFGFRPKRSAHDALQVVRICCTAHSTHLGSAVMTARRGLEQRNRRPLTVPNVTGAAKTQLSRRRGDLGDGNRGPATDSNGDSNSNSSSSQRLTAATGDGP
jgi:hypothetical protein